MLQAKSNKKDCDPRTIHSLMRGTKQMRRVRAKIETAKARAGEILPRNFCYRLFKMKSFPLKKNKGA